MKSTSSLREVQKLQLQGADKINWESAQARAASFADANKYFGENPAELKFSRKGSAQPVSFVKIDASVVAVNSIHTSEYAKMSPLPDEPALRDLVKNKFYRSAGHDTRFKCGELENGESVGVLITKKRLSSKEYRVTQNLGVDSYDAIFDSARVNLREEDKLPFFIAALEAVHKFHNATKTIHGDVKPENFVVRCNLSDAGINQLSQVILIDEPEEKLDFGRAHNANRKPYWSHSAFYLSPELKRGRCILSEKQDVYALGIMGYHLFDMKKASSGAANPVANMREVIKKMLKSKPDKRVSLEACILSLKTLCPAYDSRKIVAGHMSGNWRSCTAAVEPSRASPDQGAEDSSSSGQKSKSPDSSASAYELEQLCGAMVGLSAQSDTRHTREASTFPSVFASSGSGASEGVMPLSSGTSTPGAAMFSSVFSSLGSGDHPTASSDEKSSGVDSPASS